MESLRNAAKSFDWNKCDQLLTSELGELTYRAAFNLVMSQVKSHLHIFVSERPDAQWVSKLVELLDKFQPIEYENYSFNRYIEETANYGQRAYIEAISVLDTSFQHHLRGNAETALRLLNEAIQASIAARRYHFWHVRYPNLATTFELPETSMDEVAIRTRLHYAEDQAVNEYVRDIWYSITDDLKQQKNQ